MPPFPTPTLLRRALPLLGIAALAPPAYAVAIEPCFRLSITRYAPVLPGWPTGQRLRLGVIADLHAGGPAMPLPRIEGVVEALAAERPDLVLFLGDLNASHRFQTVRVPPEASARALGRLRPPLGLWAVNGNHDWWDDPAAMATGGAARSETEGALRAAGFEMLNNRAVRLSQDGRPFWLAGLDSQWAFRGRRSAMRGAADLAGTLRQLTDDAPALLLAHEPDIFPEVPARVSLTLSGHTHGGQIRLPGWERQIPSRFGARYAYGAIEERGRHLIVSGGLGCTGIPVRLGVPPEVLVIDLGIA